jgi:hypothetical protein
VRALQDGLRSGPRAGGNINVVVRRDPATGDTTRDLVTAGVVPDGPCGRPRVRWPMLEAYAWEPAEQRRWNSEQGRLSAQPSLRETSAGSAPEPPRARVARAAIENNRVCMLQERAEIMAQAIARSPGSFEFYGALPENAARKAGAEGA